MPDPTMLLIGDQTWLGMMALLGVYLSAQWCRSIWKKMAGPKKK